MSRFKKIICIFTVIVMVLTILPVSVVAESEEEPVLSDFTDYYGRSALEKLPNAPALLFAYDNIAAGVEESRSTIQIYNGENYISAEELNIVIDAYIRDYTHHFWLDKNYSYSYNSNGVVKYIPKYTMAGSTLEQAKSEFYAAADEILACVNDSMTDYEKELVIHDKLVEKVVYDKGASHAHDAYGALVEGRTVCEGYAEALQYLLHRAGIQSFIVLGSSRGVGHGWNVVRIDGKYYHVDSTWNDQGEDIYHAYFNMSDEMIMEDHTIDPTVYAMPVCDSMDAHYYTVNGGAFEEGEYTTDLVAELFRKDFPYARVFLYGDRDVFWEWYTSNIIEIATKTGIVGGFSYGCSILGRELLLYIDGEREEPEPEPEPEYMLGDVNGDGVITNADVLAIYRYIYNAELYPIDIVVADVNGDDLVTNADVLAIYRYIYNPELYPIG